MWAVGIGPADRVARAHLHYPHTQALAQADFLDAIARRQADRQGWVLTETEYTPDRLGHKETLFTTGNGYLCTRGAYEERYPAETRTTFAHGVFDDMPISFTELANLPDWTNLEITLEGERFALDAPGSECLLYRRELDMRTATLRRQVTWRSPAGRLVRLEWERWCSLDNPHLLHLQCTLVPLNFSGQVEIRTGLMGHTDNDGLRHITILEQGETDGLAWLHTRTRHTGIAIGQAMRVTADAPAGVDHRLCPAWGQPTASLSATVAAGERLTVAKTVTLVTGRENDAPLPRALALLRETTDLRRARAAHEAAWSAEWAASDVVIEGDPALQLAVRFNLFHLLIAAPRRDDRVSIGAKTLSGYGYRGHVFWDTEIFMLPFFALTQPRIARNLLMYRYHNLPGARAKAAANGFRGAQFPWESAAGGTEVTPRWVPHFEDPTRLVRIWPGDIELHITADIAYAAWLYWQATGDDDWLRDYGADLILEGALFWADRVTEEADGFFHLRDVIGPDEYHDHVDDNAFTNGMVAWHLQTALATLDWLAANAPARHAALVERLHLTPDRLRHWADIAGRMHIHRREDGLIEQFSGYFDRADADIAVLRDPARRKSMQVILGIEGANDSQVLKQPDVLMLQYLLRDRYAPGEIRANWDYYHPRTDHEHGSSLGPAITAAVACLLGDPEEAYRHFQRAARTDLDDTRLNTADGIHAASAGGVWQAIVFGFAGLTLADGVARFQPRLPARWKRLAFALQVRGEKLWVEIEPGQPATVTRRPA
ncbi:MAG: glycoside hydrolase family 65 protein [Caldilineae bacterium]|nr:MAG: glycoside hydrolase family 65 protein [Caldilineae bacterium]